ncbi:putative RNA-directed DNA polymerase [Tanacetum coccineum]
MTGLSRLLELEIIVLKVFLDEKVYEQHSGNGLWKVTIGTLIVADRGQRTDNILYLVHSDVCGPMKTKTMVGVLYFVTSIDDHSRREADRKKLKVFEVIMDGKYIGPIRTRLVQSRWNQQQQKTNFPPKTPAMNGLCIADTRTLVMRVRMDLAFACRVWSAKKFPYHHLRVFDVIRDVEFDEDHTLKEVEKTEKRKSQHNDDPIDLDRFHPPKHFWMHSLEMIIRMDENKDDEEQCFDELPKGKRALKNKWVYKLKTEEYTPRPRYKARLVVKVFSQKKGIILDEIFSPVRRRCVSIRCCFLVGRASLRSELEQMDVKTTFLHGDLDKEIYMEQPEWFQVKGKETTCVDFRRMYDFIILLLYVDDMLIVGKNIGRIAQLEQDLSKSFAMKDLGPAKQIFGIRIFCDRGAKKLHISQEQYIEKVLRRFNMDKAKVVSSPLTPNFKTTRIRIVLLLRRNIENIW